MWTTWPGPRSLGATNRNQSSSPEGEMEIAQDDVLIDGAQVVGRGGGVIVRQPGVLLGPVPLC